MHMCPSAYLACAMVVLVLYYIMSIGCDVAETEFFKVLYMSFMLMHMERPDSKAWDECVALSALSIAGSFSGMLLSFFAFTILYNV